MAVQYLLHLIPLFLCDNSLMSALIQFIIIIRRIISLLLVLVLCFGLIPGVSAAEADTPGTDTQTEATPLCFGGKYR